MSLGRTTVVLALSTSVLSAALIASLLISTPSSELQEFDFSTIRSAEAASTNSLFLKIDGIPGSSSTAGYTDRISLLWYCFGFSSRSDIPGCNTHEGKGSFDKSDFDGFHFIMEDNKATPKLMLAYLNKTAIKTVTFYAQKATGTAGSSDYLVVTLSDVRVTSYFHASNENYNKPVVEATMTYSKIEMTYKDGKQNYTAGWNFKTGKPI